MPLITLSTVYPLSRSGVKIITGKTSLYAPVMSEIEFRSEKNTFFLLIYQIVEFFYNFSTKTPR